MYSWEASIAELIDSVEGVNDAVGHTTCHVCALKSHILQTRIIGHTTCKTCAPEVTNRFAVRFFVKTHYTLGTWGQLDFFFAFYPLAENYVVQFHPSNFKNLVNLPDEVIQTNFDFWFLIFFNAEQIDLISKFEQDCLRALERNTGNQRFGVWITKAT
jgi:hypothetical protein